MLSGWCLSLRVTLLGSAWSRGTAEVSGRDWGCSGCPRGSPSGGVPRVRKHGSQQTAYVSRASSAEDETNRLGAAAVAVLTEALEGLGTLQ